MTQKELVEVMAAAFKLRSQHSCLRLGQSLIISMEQVVTDPMLFYHTGDDATILDLFWRTYAS
jgi:hypothetical protein